MRHFRIYILVSIVVSLSCAKSQNIPSYFTEVVQYLEQLEAIKVEQGQRPVETDGDKGTIFYIDYNERRKFVKGSSKVIAGLENSYSRLAMTGTDTDWIDDLEFVNALFIFSNSVADESYIEPARSQMEKCINLDKPVLLEKNIGEKLIRSVFYKAFMDKEEWREYLNYNLLESSGKEYIKARLVLLLLQTHVAERDINTARDKLGLYKNLLDTASYDNIREWIQRAEVDFQDPSIKN